MRLWWLVKINFIYFYIFNSKISKKIELEKNLFKVYINFYLFIDQCLFEYCEKAFNSSLNQKQIKIFSLIKQDKLHVVTFLQPSVGIVVVGDPVSSIIATGVSVLISDTVNDSIVKSAESALTPITSKLPASSFNESIEAALNSMNDGSLQAVFLPTVSIKSEDELSAHLNKGEHYLLVDSTYKLDFDYRTFIIESNVSLNTFGNREALYANQFEYSGTTLPDVFRTSEQITSDVASLKKEFHSLGKYKKAIRRIVKYYKKLIKSAGQAEYKGLLLVNKRIKMWSNEYFSHLNRDFKQGPHIISKLLVADIASDDIVQSSLHLVNQKLMNDTFLPETSGERVLMRFTHGSRIGSLCSKPKETIAEKDVCLANNEIDSEILGKWSMSKLKPY